MSVMIITASPKKCISCPSIIIALLFAISIMSCSVPALAETSPFEALAGRWSGWGWVNMHSGARERVRCRVNYRSKKNTRLNQRIRCASTSYKIEASASMRRKGKRISGSWKETKFATSGRLSGRTSRKGLDISMFGAAFQAGMSIKLVGKCKQSVSIKVSGIEIRSVSMQLKRC